MGLLPGLISTGAIAGAVLGFAMELLLRYLKPLAREDETIDRLD
jgi:hypothetical protein